MDFISLIAVAIGLSLDAFTVSLTNSTVIKNLELKHGFRMALFFGFFQMIMPVIGWAAGLTFSKYILSFDHWVAFGLLAFVGGRMVWGGLPFGKKDVPEGACADEGNADCRNLPTLFLLSIATSIDALAVGLSFALIDMAIIVPVLVIGLVTFLITLAGYFIGSRLGHRINLPLEMAGGFILIGIGVKIVVDHLLAG